MEHIVQFAIGIDDNAIVKRVSENAEREIINDLKQQVVNRIFESRSYYNKNADHKTDPLSYFARELVTSVIEENRDAIIEKASKYLADKIANTKKGKEILDNLKE